MHKRFDNIFSALMLAAAVAVILVGSWVLRRSIERAGAEAPPPVAEVHIGLPPPAPELTPAPLPTPTPILYDPAVPLAPELQAVLREACAEHGVPFSLALGLIEVESRFQVDADNGVSYGLLQLNKKYFPDKLSPSDNIRAGIEYLGWILAQHGDTAAALTAYNCGHDTGARGYANAVLEAAGRWDVP